MTWSQTTPTVPGAPEVPLRALAEIASLPDPTEDAVRRVLPAAQPDADNTVAVLTGLFRGETPPTPAATPSGQASASPFSAPVSPDPSEKEDTMSPTPDPGTAPAGLSLAERLKRKKRGVRPSHVIINEKDFETDPYFDELFLESDAGFDYSTPEGFVSPGAPTVTYEATEPTSDEAEPTESVLITWKPIPGAPKETTLYRVLVADHEVDAAPGNGTQLVLTHGTAFRDTRPSATGFRHYMVWAYTGQDEDELLELTPLFLGEDIAIFPPGNVRLAESGGTVNGTWDARQGHDEVRVYHARKGYAGRLNAPAHLLLKGTERSGFSHRVDVRGLTYEYTVAPVVSFRGKTRIGASIPSIPVQVSAEIQKIDLLDVEARSDNGEDRIVVTWTAPPTGSVKIYLTDRAPNPALPLDQVDKDYLEDDDALGSTKWTAVEKSMPGDLVSKSMVWPAGWHQVYVTPVNIVEERAWVGDSSVLQKVESLTEPRLIERITNQLVTFDWPGGADLIDISTKDGTHLRLDEDSYRRQGGVRLTLLSSGDTVTLTPVAVYAGEDKRARNQTVIEYPGLRAYSYDLLTLRDGSMQLQIWSAGHPDANAPHFKLVHRTDRLPLSISDGEGKPVRCVKVKPGTEAEAQPGYDIFQPALPAERAFHEGEDRSGGHGLVTATAEDATWWVDNTGFHGGYLRLFIDNTATELSGTSTAPDADTYDSYAAPDTGFSRDAFGGGAFAGSLSVAPAVESGGSGHSGETADEKQTWHAASIPAVIIERDVASRLALPDHGRMR